MTGPLTVVLALGCLAFALWAAFLLYRDRPVGRRTVAAAVRRRVSDPPVWLSTAGMGVSWLHLRLDSQPKYYRHGPYRATMRQ